MDEAAPGIRKRKRIERDPAVAPPAEPASTRLPKPPADRAAAALLRGLLDGTLTPKEARARWPKEQLTQPAAVSYVRYFEKGFDDRGTRHPGVDEMVEQLATLLDGGPRDAP